MKPTEFRSPLTGHEPFAGKSGPAIVVHDSISGGEANTDTGSAAHVESKIMQDNLAIADIFCESAAVDIFVP